MELIIISRPIRKSLLIHEVIYTPNKKDDDLGWGKGIPQPITLKNVRLEPKEMTSTDTNGATITSNTTLFWDSFHSTEVEFEHDATINWGSKQYLIKQIDDYFDSNKLHHKELRLL